MGKAIETQTWRDMFKTPQPAHKEIPAFHVLGFRPWAPSFRFLALVFLEGKDAGLVEASNTSLFLLTESDSLGGKGRKKGREGGVAWEMKADVVTYG